MEVGSKGVTERIAASLKKGKKILVGIRWGEEKRTRAFRGREGGQPQRGGGWWFQLLPSLVKRGEKKALW